MTMQSLPIRGSRQSLGSRLFGVVLTAAVVTTLMPVEAADAPVAISHLSSSATSAKPTYYVVKRISVTTDNGVRSVTVGAPVELVTKSKSSCKIKLADGTQLATTMDCLSLDQEAANRLADQERTAQEVHDATVRQSVEADQARRQAQAEANEQAMREAQKKIPPTTASSASTDSAPSQPGGLRGSALDDRSGGTVAHVAHPKVRPPVATPHPK